MQPDAWVFPPGMALYAAFNPTVSDYNKEGNSVTLSTGPEALGTFRGTSVYETREFDVRNGELPINLMQRRVQIGEHYFMRNHHNDARKYEAHTSMSIVVYDEKKDDWAKIGFYDALNHALENRFDGDEPDDLDGMGPGGPDVFGFRDSDYGGDDSYQTAEYFGQMEQGGNGTPDHLPYEALRAFCESAEARLGNLGNADPFVALRTRDAEDRLILRDEAFNTDYRAWVNPINRIFPDLDDGSHVETNDNGWFQGESNFNVLINILMPRPMVVIPGRAAAQEVTVGDLQKLDKTADLATLAAMNLSDREKVVVKYLIDNFTVKKSHLKNIRAHTNWAAAEEATTGPSTFGSPDVKGYRVLGYATRGYIESRNHDNALVIFPSGNNGSFVPIAIKDCRTQLLAHYPPIGQFHVTGQLTVPAYTNAVIGDKFKLGDKRNLGETDVDSWSKRRAVETGADFGDAADFAQSYIGSKRTERAAKAVAGASAADLELDLGKYDLAYTTTYRNFTVNGKADQFARKAGNLPTTTQRILAYCLYHTKITASALQIFSANNIVLPVSLLIARPYMTYDMCTCIMMKGGTETGQTFQGHSDFQLGDDVQSKIHYGNYTYYSKAVVTNPKNIIHARNVFANGYVSGDATDWIRMN